MSPFASRLKKKKKDFLGKRQEEDWVLKDGAWLFQELIASCDGKDYYPIRIFSANDLINVTEDKHYSCDHYRGTYQDRQIFIKSRQRDHMNMLLFINEVVSLAQINHRNVVKLLGCCFEMHSRMVVYELLPNTLQQLLGKENPSNQISWENRLRIAIEIANAITYLHIAKPSPIIHRDIASKNILLDEHCRPKLCSFSHAIAIPLGETHVQTNRITGTFGYIEPHYMFTGIVTEKVDVYSFGWLMLEILSRKNPIEIAEYEEGNLRKKRTIEQVLEIVKRLSMISEASLPVDKRKIEQLMACVELAGRCIADEPDQRPTMKEVALELRQVEKHQLPCYSSSSSSS